MAKKDNRQSGFCFGDFELFATESAERLNEYAADAEDYDPDTPITVISRSANIRVGCSDLDLFDDEEETPAESGEPEFKIYYGSVPMSR